MNIQDKTLELVSALKVAEKWIEREGDVHILSKCLILFVSFRTKVICHIMKHFLFSTHKKNFFARHKLKMR